ncbi:MAG: hypothetical protein U0S50_02490 [Sphingopyxis sp.]|uniref:hypothetical protein n=1 Tax=Sphingopyxis sp. TaxID=1908224 RepID=UPI002ABBD464|nr:hypothetical protein [Sphingopyxis sp.]MDZ3830670.1 hypothetical protein [Sphingopyxis sp.]
MGRFKFAGIAGLALFVSGCASIDKYHVPPPGIVSDTHAPDRILYDHAIKDTDPRLQSPTLANAFIRRYRDLWDAGLPSGDKQDMDVKALETTKLGMTLVELRCELFFSSIGRGSQKMDFIHREVEILTSALTATLGLISASDNAVTGAGLLSGATLSSLDNYSNVFFFSPEVGKVQRLVADAFAVLRAETFAPSQVPKDFDAMVRAIKRHQSICTPHEIRRLVNEAVDAGEIEVVYRDGAVKGGLDPHLERLFDRIAALLSGAAPPGNVPGITPRQAVLIKWLLETPSGDEPNFICLALESEDLRRKLCQGATGNHALNSALTDADKAALRDLLKAVELSSTGWVEKDLATFKSAYAAQKSRIDGLLAQIRDAKDEAERQRARGDFLDVMIASTGRVSTQTIAPAVPTEMSVKAK